MRRTLPLLALAVLAAGGCGQKGPLYLPDKGGRAVTSAPAGAQSATAPAAAPAPATPAAASPGAPKPADKDKDQESQPPR